MKSIILCGVGGQGTVLASRLISSTALEKGMAVKAAETIGMAQRGGSVLSHVRLGEGAYAPLVGKARADLMMAFEPAEALRNLESMKPKGTIVLSNRPIVPVSASVGGPRYDLCAIMASLEQASQKCIVVDAQRAAEDLGSDKCLNVVLLGAAAHAGVLGFSPEEIEEVLVKTVPQRFVDLNVRALAWASSQTN